MNPLVFFVLAISTVLAKDCPVTFIKAYEYGCNRRGWILDPYPLKKYSADTREECGQRCLANKACKSMKYVLATKTCYTYSRYLDQMSTDFDNYKPGRLFDRECFTTDCDAIAACNATKPCLDYIEGGTRYYDYFYNQFACATGRTSRTYEYDYFDVALNGSLTACDAVQQCAKGSGGTLDIHYHKPSNTWICRTFSDGGGYPTPTGQVLTRARYTVRNESVGAGYGWFCRSIQYDPPYPYYGDY